MIYIHVGPVHFVKLRESWLKRIQSEYFLDLDMGGALEVDRALHDKGIDNFTLAPDAGWLVIVSSTNECKIVREK